MGTVLFFKVDGPDSNDTVTYSYDNIAKILSKNTMLNYLLTLIVCIAHNNT